MQRRIELLISEARTESDNLEFTDETGIQTNEFLRWANSAQTRLSSLIQLRFPQVFQKVKTVQAVIGQEAYDLPNDVFYNARIQQVDYSRTGNDQDYYPLHQGRLIERLSTNPSVPAFYIRRSNSILIQPRPSEAGTFRITYQKKFAKIDIRRGTIQAAVLDTVNRTITSMNFDPSLDFDATTIMTEQYMTIIDKNGVIQMQAIPVDNIDTTTGVITVSPGFVYEEGETITAGNYGCAGPMSTTNSELPDEAERYLTEMMIWKANKRDSSNDSIEGNEELTKMENEIIDTYSEPSGDIDYVPVIDGQYGIFERF